MGTDSGVSGKTFGGQCRRMVDGIVDADAALRRGGAMRAVRAPTWGSSRHAWSGSVFLSARPLPDVQRRSPERPGSQPWRACTIRWLRGIPNISHSVRGGQRPCLAASCGPSLCTAVRSCPSPPHPFIAAQLVAVCRPKRDDRMLIRDVETFFVWCCPIAPNAAMWQAREMETEMLHRPSGPQGFSGSMLHLHRIRGSSKSSFHLLGIKHAIGCKAVRIDRKLVAAGNEWTIGQR